MVTVSDLIFPASANVERPEEARFIKAPRWCADCDAGCSYERCWLCAGPTVELGRRDRALGDGKMAWRPPE